MNDLRTRLKSIRLTRMNLRREVAIRDQVIETLCYRYVIQNQLDGGRSRAQVYAEHYIESATKGTLDPNMVPPSQALVRLLVSAYYVLHGRISMCHMNPGRHFHPRSTRTWRGRPSTSTR